MDKQLLEKILKCPICLGVLLRSMVQPVKCGGLSWKDGVLCTRFGTPWSEVTKKIRDKDRKELEVYMEKNKDHIAEHGLVRCDRKGTCAR